VALLVGPDLRGAEAYYANLFELDVVLREGPLESGGPDAGLWGQLPPEKSWDDAAAAGVEIGMVALQRDDVILALFAVPPTGVGVYAFGLVMDEPGIERVADRLEGETIESHENGWLAFVDRMGVRWQLSSSAPFRGAGADGSWLEV
jgi:hypothetical protein